MNSSSYTHIDRGNLIKKEISETITICAKIPNPTLKPLLETLEKFEGLKPIMEKLKSFKVDELKIEEVDSIFRKLIEHFSKSEEKEFINKQLGEITFEYIRLKEFSSDNLPSRFDCIYLFNDENIGDWGDVSVGNGVIYRMESVNTNKMFVADAKWKELGTHKSLSERIDYARKYWNGEHTDNSKMEVLFCGELKIIDKN